MIALLAFIILVPLLCSGGGGYRLSKPEPKPEPPIPWGELGTGLVNFALIMVGWFAVVMFFGYVLTEGV